MKRLTLEDFIEKSKLVHGNKYNYSKSKYINSRTKVEIICNKCKKTFKMLPTAHYFSKQGCPFCSVEKQQSNNKRENKEAKINFIEKSKLVHNNEYDYSNTEYIDLKTKVKIFCKKCNKYFFQLPGDHLKGYGCNCHKSYRGEKIIKNYLEENNISFIPQKTFPNLKDINNLSYDFYLQENNLLIEYNGKQHYKWVKRFQPTLHIFHLQKHHDWLKRKYARNNNINLLVIPFWKIKDINNILKSYLGGKN